MTLQERMDKCSATMMGFQDAGASYAQKVAYAECVNIVEPIEPVSGVMLVLFGMVCLLTLLKVGCLLLPFFRHDCETPNWTYRR